MKKWIIFCLSICLTVLCACKNATGEQEQNGIESVETQEESVGSETTQTPDKKLVVSYLTGLECTPQQREQRPLAVMLNNIKVGCPQAGIGEAAVIYEAPMEKADVTRLMALFENWQDMDKIGYIRSSRDYFVYCALEFDAIYAHYGQATPYVGDLLNSDRVDNISGAVAGIDRPATKAFMRSDDRKAPHNVYSTGEDMLAAVEKFEYSLTYHDSHRQKFVFIPPGSRMIYEDGSEATMLYPGGKKKGIANGYANVQAYFEYNEEDGKYYRYQYGDEHIDELTGEQLAVDNVIFQYCNGEFRDNNGYMAFNCHGGWEQDADKNDYRAQIFTAGRMIEGSWFRTEDSAPAIYVDENGESVILNPGKTWICLIWNDHADDVVIE